MVNIHVRRARKKLNQGQIKAGSVNRKGEEMNLISFSKKVGIAVSDLTSINISNAVRQGIIGKRVGARIIRELNQADRIWQSLAPDVKQAHNLW